MPPRAGPSHGWTVAFVLVCVLGVLLILAKGCEERPVGGPLPPAVPTEPTDEPSGPSGREEPEPPGDVTVVLRVTADRPLAAACFSVPSAVGRTKGCEEQVASFRRRLRAGGPLVSASVNGLAGPGGGRVSCSVRIDGELVRRDRAEGPWQGAWCTGVRRVP